jgi:hypothetical protein
LEALRAEKSLGSVRSGRYSPEGAFMH